MNKNYQQYFNQDLAQQLRSNSWLLSSEFWFCSIPNEEILYANMFLSVFEAGDKFEGNNLDIANHIDLSTYVSEKYPQLRKFVPYYCKVYNFYRNFAWKMICVQNANISDKIIRIEQFFSWIRTVVNITARRSFVIPNDNAYYDSQIKEQIDSGNFTLAPFVNAYLSLTVANDIIILPQSMRIVQLKGITVDNLLSERNRNLIKVAGKVESAIAEIVDEMLDNDD